MSLFRARALSRPQRSTAAFPRSGIQARPAGIAAVLAMLAFVPDLQARAGEVLEVAEGIYVATGFGPSNSTVIAGEDAAILIDAHHSAAAANRAAAAYREHVDLPFAAVIYTHGDQSHVAGAAAFTSRYFAPNVYARANYVLRRSVIGAEAHKRRQRLKGLLLDEAQRAPTPIDPLPAEQDSGDRYLPPDSLFYGDRYRLHISGVRLELVAAPGETRDQLYAWLPQRKALIAGGNFYPAFPGDLDGIGGSGADLEQWARSLDRMRSERAEVLIPGHLQPLVGAQVIDRALADYAAALRFILDETLRGIDAGLGPEELAAAIRLPETLASSPVLEQSHGALDWAVRSVYARRMGWFDGVAGSLAPLSPRTLAWRLRELASGSIPLDQALDNALLLTDYRWASYLADQLMLTEPSQPRHVERKAQALEGMARGVENPRARNYLLSTAKELRLNAPRPLAP